MTKGNKKDSGYDRDPDEWYVEDEPCVQSLFRAMPWFYACGAHDPCCGGGNIVRVGKSMGVAMTGSDKVDRCNGLYPVRDFLADNSPRPAIVSNPPFNIAPMIVRHALDVTADGGYVALIGQAKFFFSQSRHPLFARREMDRVLVLSTRPSMPPGKALAAGTVKRGGGFHDFAWFVWRVGKTSLTTTIEWLP